LLFDTKYAYAKEVTSGGETTTVKVGLRIWGFRQAEDGKKGAAELADVNLGDILATINGKDVSHTNFEDIINMVKTNEKWPLILMFKPISVLKLPQNARRKPKKARRNSVKTANNNRATSLLNSASLLMKKLSNVASGHQKPKADPLTVHLFNCGQKGDGAKFVELVAEVRKRWEQEAEQRTAQAEQREQMEQQGGGANGSMEKNEGASQPEQTTELADLAKIADGIWKVFVSPNSMTTVSHVAAKYGNLPMLRLLRQLELDEMQKHQSAAGEAEPASFLSLLNCADRRGICPIHLAAEYGHPPVVHFLVAECGVDPTVLIERNGASPAHAAAVGGQVGVLHLLAELGGGLDTLTLKGSTPAEVARHFGQQRAADLIDALVASAIGAAVSPNSTACACGKRHLVQTEEKKTPDEGGDSQGDWFVEAETPETPGAVAADEMPVGNERASMAVAADPSLDTLPVTDFVDTRLCFPSDATLVAIEFSASVCTCIDTALTSGKPRVVGRPPTFMIVRPASARKEDSRLSLLEGTEQRRFDIQAEVEVGVRGRQAGGLEFSFGHDGAEASPESVRAGKQCMTSVHVLKGAGRLEVAKGDMIGWRQWADGQAVDMSIQEWAGEEGEAGDASAGGDAVGESVFSRHCLRTSTECFAPHRSCISSSDKGEQEQWSYAVRLRYSTKGEGGEQEGGNAVANAFANSASQPPVESRAAGGSVPVGRLVNADAFADVIFGGSDKVFFENERYQPFLGGYGASYPGHLLPQDRGRWSNRSGSAYCRVLVPGAMGLAPNTKIVGCDDKGWEYAFDFANFSRSLDPSEQRTPDQMAKKRSSLVRRRQWVRKSGCPVQIK
jgi:hypothetical protein